MLQMKKKAPPEGSARSDKWMFMQTVKLAGSTNVEGSSRLGDNYSYQIQVKKW